MEPVRRVNFWTGMLLTADDLAAEQDYHRSMRYLSNRLHGWGVVEGLEVSSAGGSTVRVSAGVAIDRLGREVVLAGDCDVDACSGGTTDGDLDLIIWWAEEPDGHTPTVDGETFGRWLERPLLGVSAAGQLPAGAPAEALVLARLHVAGGSVVGVDHSARSTWTPATSP